MCKLQSVCVKLSHLNATPIPASLKGLSVHVDFQLFVRIFDFCFVLVSKFGLLMCSFNGVLVVCENSRHSYLGTVFVVDESMWPEEIGSLTPMSRLMHVMLQTSHMRIVLGWVCVIEHLVQQMIPDDSVFWSAVCGSRDVFLQSQKIQENKMGNFSGFTSILTEWTIKRVWLFILLISWGKFPQVRLKTLVDFANQC